MGHRALAAYEREDGRYDLHYSHWGAADFALAHDITAETPYGGESPNSSLETLRRRLAAGDEFDVLGGRLADDRPATPVDQEPTARALSLDDALADHLDYRQYEAFYVVTTAHDVTAHRVLWVPFPAEEGPLGYGALVAVRWRDGDPADPELGDWFRTAVDIVGDVVDRGVLTPTEATAYLDEKFTRRTSDRCASFAEVTPAPD